MIVVDLLTTLTFVEVILSLELVVSSSIMVIINFYEGLR